MWGKPLLRIFLMLDRHQRQVLALALFNQGMQWLI
jgi:hypothetical protein